MLTLDVHPDGPDEAEQLAPHGGHDLLVRHASFGKSSIALMEPVLGLPGDRFHGLLDPFLPCSQRTVDSRPVPVGPCRFDEHASEMAVAGLCDSSATRLAAARVLARHGAAVAHQLGGVIETRQLAYL